MTIVILTHPGTNYRFSFSKFPSNSKHPIFQFQPPDQANEEHERNQINSFRNWPCPHIGPDDLAAASSDHTGQVDQARCFDCGLEIVGWETGDDSMSEDQRWSGTRCKFVQKLPCGNAPNNRLPSVAPRNVPAIENIGNSTAKGPSSAYSGLRDTIERLLSTSRLGCTGIITHKKPKYPEYVTFEARMRTFKDWPATMPQKRERLADAGFFWRKTADETVCFSCGKGLKNWEANDNPWVEHAKYYSTCYYVMLNKGQDFIDSVKQIRRTSQGTQTGEDENTSAISEPVQEKDPIEEEPTEPEEKPPEEEGRICKICREEELGVAFLPCGHSVSCVNCAPNATICALCKKPVARTIRLFFS